MTVITNAEIVIENENTKPKSFPNRSPGQYRCQSQQNIKPVFSLSLKWTIYECMLIEQTKNNQIVITISSTVDSFGLQRLIDYVKYLEATSKSKAKQSAVDKLAAEVNASWWKENRKRFIK